MKSAQQFGDHDAACDKPDKGYANRTSCHLNQAAVIHPVITEPFVRWHFDDIVRRGLYVFGPESLGGARPWKAVHKKTSESLWSCTQACLDNKVKPGFFQRSARVSVVDPAKRRTRFIGCASSPLTEAPLLDRGGESALVHESA